MIDFLIKALGLKSRIYSGYILLGAVALLIAVVAFFSLNKLKTEFQDYSAFTDGTIENVNFSVQMSEMQRQALIYIYEGHDSAGDRVAEIYQGMIKQLKSQALHNNTVANQRLFTTEQHLENYFKTFQEVRQQRQLQNTLVITTLRSNANKAQTLIEQLIASSSTNEKEENTKLLYNQMLISFLKIEKNAYRYFDTLNSERIKQASISIAETEKLMALIKSEDPTKSAEHRAITSALIKYENSYYEAVQRTRGYLFLVNVVMAAEAYETLYQTKQYAALIKAQTQQTKTNVFKSIENTVYALISSSFIFIIGVGFLSLAISRSITLPIKRITNAFNKLTKGSLNVEIPHYEQMDEIGELTKAATSYKESNIELEHKKQELERSNDELEQFVYTVSHDLKSPIVTSMGFIGIIQKLAKQGKFEQAIEKLDRVVNSNRRMSQLVNDLLELSRVGRTDSDKTSIDLNELFRAFYSSQAERMKRSSATMEIEGNLPTIFANESRVLQVFENLLSNALKYGSGNNGTSIKVGIKDDPKHHFLYFADNGQGIPTEYQEKIFGLFYRLDSNFEGTGIGLTVSKKVMTNHGGKIWVESSPGNGATFWLSFPKELITNLSPEKSAEAI
ncbi:MULTISPECIES: HAMP domain-containing sensor histidine kinase [unclassified Neptuniibacter]|uniref:sensor histidine kinase n=1 Tax=unclassified Neptuniibacter TaxID=2630693 RepID=UPI000C60FD68|nr:MULTISPECIES: HAMP domain-containing sensor histidine kinase [unclassified Neptuniibacter]MAY42300.1 hypothetical protein [Oceanospirillaceae bacterium]|tara:strand:- start:4832 stop:6688 length:1857 start_codon:yes stop_codon:yes gene_type:complete